MPSISHSGGLVAMGLVRYHGRGKRGLERGAADRQPKGLRLPLETRSERPAAANCNWWQSDAAGCIVYT